MEGFISFIFYAIITVWLLGLLARFLLRRWVNKKQREFSERFGDGAQYGRQSHRGGGRSQRKTGNEGDIHVQQTVRIEKKVSNNVGEYVEFEEVEVTEEINDKE